MTPKEIKERLIKHDEGLVNQWNEMSFYRTLGIEERMNFLERRLMVTTATLSWALDHLISQEDDGK